MSGEAMPTKERAGFLTAGSRGIVGLRGYAVVAAGLLAAGVVPLFTNEYQQYVVNLMLIYMLVALGFNIVLGYLGQLAFANVAFFGIGAYTAGLSMLHFNAPVVLAIPIAGAVGALSGCLVSIPALRGIRALYLAMITLAFGELMRWGYIHADAITMGSTGFAVPSASVFSIPVATEDEKFYLFLFVTVLVFWGTVRLLRSRFGRAIVSIRNHELSAAALGIPTARYIILAFAWSGFITAVAGALLAILIGRVVPESFTLVELIKHFAMVMVGGIGSVGGSILGAVLLTLGPELFRQYPGLEEIMLASLIILVLLFMPRGVISIVARIYPRAAERFYVRPRA